MPLAIFLHNAIHHSFGKRGVKHTHQIHISRIVTKIFILRIFQRMQHLLFSSDIATCSAFTTPVNKTMIIRIKQQGDTKVGWQRSFQRCPDIRRHLVFRRSSPDGSINRILESRFYFHRIPGIDISFPGYADNSIVLWFIESFIRHWHKIYNMIVSSSQKHCRFQFVITLYIKKFSATFKICCLQPVSRIFGHCNNPVTGSTSSGIESYIRSVVLFRYSILSPDYIISRNNPVHRNLRQHI